MLKADLIEGGPLESIKGLIFFNIGWKVDGDDGDRDAWYVTKNGESSGAIIYSQYEVTCPSDSERFRFARMSPGIEWQMTG